MSKWLVFAYETTYHGSNGYNGFQVVTGDREEAEQVGAKLAEEVMNLVVDEEWGGDFAEYEMEFQAEYKLFRIKSYKLNMKNWNDEEFSELFRTNLDYMACRWIEDYEDEFRDIE